MRPRRYSHRKTVELSKITTQRQLNKKVSAQLNTQLSAKRISTKLKDKQEKRGVCKCIAYPKYTTKPPKSVRHKKTQESLVLVGCDVTIDTPLAYQRSRLLRLLGETSS